MSEETKCPKCGGLGWTCLDGPYHECKACSHRMMIEPLTEVESLRAALSKAVEALKLAKPFVESAKRNAERGSYAAFDALTRAENGDL